MFNNSNQEKNALNTEGIAAQKLDAWCWGISIFLNILVLIFVLYATDVVYETNDDYGIAQELAAGYPHVGFVNYYLCRALIPIQNFFSQYNVFVISQIIASFVAFTVLLKTFIGKSESKTEIILAALVCAFLSFDHYSAIQFTKTAGLLITAGSIYLVDTYAFERSLPRFTLAFVLIFLGVAYRQKSMTPAISYAACFVIVWLLINGKEFLKTKNKVRETVLICVIVLISVAPYGFDKLSDAANVSTPELKYAREYQAERSVITDYPILSSYDEHKEEYDNMGISLNDLTMINRWMFDYDGAASLENLKRINEINSKNATSTMSLIKATKKAVKGGLQSVLDLDFMGMHIIIALGISLYIICNNKKENWVYIVVLGMLTIALHIAVYYMQRVQYRALYIANESIILWLLYVSFAGKRATRKFSKQLSLICLCVAIIIMAKPAISRLDSMKNRNEAKLESTAVLDYFEQHKENFYIGPTSTMRQPQSYITPLLAPTMPVNVSGTGGWETLTPYKLDFLQNYGVNNPIKDLIDADNVLFFGNYKKDMIKEYMEKWYCDEKEIISFVKVDEIDNNEIYKIVREPKL